MVITYRSWRSSESWLALTCVTGVVLVASRWRSQRRRREQLRCSPGADETALVGHEHWDYIIVGGGTAGCVLANRLSKPPLGGVAKRVLVLEAGSSENEVLDLRIPAGVLNAFQSSYDWNFTTDEGSPGQHGIYLARGKVLGGSSNLNVMLYTRGNASDYDAWVTEYGCEGWSAADVLRCFKRTECDRTGAAARDSKHHSGDGEWTVDSVRYQNPLSKRFLEAASQFGSLANDDFNSWAHDQEGFGRFPVSQDNGSRCSAASALLAPVTGQNSLSILCGAQVERVCFQGKQAVGVEFRVGKQVHTAKLAPTGEVLLTCGAIHSPQLLMLSGIGPSDHLTKHGIPVVSNLLGVGENLQDQPAANVSFACNGSGRGLSPTSHTYWVLGRKIPHPWWIVKWLLWGTGALTSPGCDHGGFFRTKEAIASPDLQLRFLPARAVTADGMNSFATFRDQREPLPDGFTFQSIAVRALSKGAVRLRSRNVEDAPLIRGGYLSNTQDMATLREGLRLARKMAAQPAFDAVRGDEVFPGKNVQTDAELDAYIAKTVHTANAVVGTCRMGQVGDPLTVCDPSLRVLGVNGLRVCDSSVMPTIPGGQAGAATVMIAERAAEILRS